MPIRAAFGAAAAAACLLAGCGTDRSEPPPKTNVTGRVTLHGRPLTGGEVVFLAADGTTHVRPVAPDGTYSAVNVPEGPARVAVRSDPSQLSGPPPLWAQHKAKEAKEQGKTFTPEELTKVEDPVLRLAYMESQGMAPARVPGRYADPKTSKLAHTVVSGPQTYDVPLD
jgi:hypothetical protein